MVKNKRIYETDDNERLKYWNYCHVNFNKPSIRLSYEKKGGRKFYSSRGNPWFLSQNPIIYCQDITDAERANFQNNLNVLEKQMKIAINKLQVAFVRMSSVEQRADLAFANRQAMNNTLWYFSITAAEEDAVYNNEEAFVIASNKLTRIARKLARARALRTTTNLIGNKHICRADYEMHYLKESENLAALTNSVIIEAGNKLMNAINAKDPKDVKSIKLKYPECLTETSVFYKGLIVNSNTDVDITVPECQGSQTYLDAVQEVYKTANINSPLNNKDRKRILSEMVRKHASDSIAGLSGFNSTAKEKLPLIKKQIELRFDELINKNCVDCVNLSKLSEFKKDTAIESTKFPSLISTTATKLPDQPKPTNPSVIKINNATQTDKPRENINHSLQPPQQKPREAPHTVSRGQQSVYSNTSPRRFVKHTPKTIPVYNIKKRLFGNEDRGPP